MGKGRGSRSDRVCRCIKALVGDDGVDWPEGPVRRIRYLTEREFDVFVLLGQGFSNQDISQLLIVTERTVKANVTRILAKLQLQSRLQAGLVAQRHTHADLL